jgi:hypothetical protein
MNTYDIMEYNQETQHYITIGHIQAEGHSEAKQKYIEKFKWEPKPNVVLFAKPPICR